MLAFFGQSLAQPNLKAATQPSAVDVSTATVLLSGSSDGPHSARPKDVDPPAASTGVPLAMGSTASPRGEAEPLFKIMGAQSSSIVVPAPGPGHAATENTTANKRPTPVDDRMRALKKMKQADVAPSLLSRMGTSVTDRSSSSSSFTHGIPPSGRQEVNTSFQLPNTEPEFSAGGYSIRGAAAKAERRADSTSGSTWSLLDRIKDQSPGAVGDANAARRRRRRGGGGRHRSR